MADAEKFRRELIRWQILVTLNVSRPDAAYDALLLAVIRREFPDATRREVRREADYLADRKLVVVAPSPDDAEWRCDITRDGVDVVEYTVECDPGIARPREKYW